MHHRTGLCLRHKDPLDSGKCHDVSWLMCVCFFFQYVCCSMLCAMTCNMINMSITFPSLHPSWKRARARQLTQSSQISGVQKVVRLCLHYFLWPPVVANTKAHSVLRTPWTASLFRVFQVSPLCFQSTTFHWWSATTCFKDQTAIWFKCIQVRLWKDQLLILSLISFIGFNFLPSFKSRLVKPGGISGHFTSQDPQVLNTLTLWSHLRKAPCLTQPWRS